MTEGHNLAINHNSHTLVEIGNMLVASNSNERIPKCWDKSSVAVSLDLSTGVYSSWKRI